MSDDGFTWDDVEAIEPPPGAAAAAEEAGAEGAAEGGAEGETKAEEPAKPRYVPQKDSEIQALHFPRYQKRDCRKGREFHYWARPTTLQYRYNYDYAHNYYDDCIKYLDNKSRGERKDIPRPQTWAERALRTYTKGHVETAAYESLKEDKELLTKVTHSAKFYAQHSKEFYNRKYRDVLYAYIAHWP
uniref:Flightin n=1 Tax=Cacopsylla melanoneura TaxID=428564 RepID=A0A8D8X2X0_9HEMI